MKTSTIPSTSLLAGLTLCAMGVWAIPSAKADPADRHAVALVKDTTEEEPDEPDDPAEAGAAKSGQKSSHGKKTGDEGILGDAAGLRPLFARYGVTFDISETSELLGNPTGGFRQGAIYEGLFSTAVGVDLEKALGMKGASLNVSLFQLHGGPGLSASNIGNFNVVSDLENKRASGLYEAWVQQAFGTAFDIRAGHMSADEEFMLADSADVFMNGSFGWPTLPFKDLPNGGPIPAEVAIRAHARLNDEWEALTGVYRGSQSSPREAKGAAAPAPAVPDDGLFAIAELQYVTGQKEGELPATYKVGGWYRNGAVTSLKASTIADTLVTLPDIVRRNFSFYAVADHRLTRGSDDEDSGFSAFLRVMAAPADRNIVTAFADGGLAYSGPFGRKDDGLGLGFAVAQTSATAHDTLGRQSVRLGKAETSVEATYQAQLATGIQLQPDLQYIINPAGGHLTRTGHSYRDALVFGLRTTITF